MLSVTVFAQTKIYGTVSDKHHKRFAGANIYLKGTFDGATSGQDGPVSFYTNEKGDHTLLISQLGYQQDPLQIQIENMSIYGLTFQHIKSDYT